MQKSHFSGEVKPDRGAILTDFGYLIEWVRLEQLIQANGR